MAHIFHSRAVFLGVCDRAEKRLRMLEIGNSKSFDRPFVWRHASLISRSILALCHSRKQKSGRDLKVFSVVEIFSDKLGICLSTDGCFKSRGNPANS